MLTNGKTKSENEKRKPNRKRQSKLQNVKLQRPKQHAKKPSGPPNSKRKKKLS